MGIIQIKRQFISFRLNLFLQIQHLQASKGIYQHENDMSERSDASKILALLILDSTIGLFNNRFILLVYFEHQKEK